MQAIYHVHDPTNIRLHLCRDEWVKLDVELIVGWHRDSRIEPVSLVSRDIYIGNKGRGLD